MLDYKLDFYKNSDIFLNMNKTDTIDALKNDMPLTDFIRGVNKKISDSLFQ